MKRPFLALLLALLVLLGASPYLDHVAWGVAVLDLGLSGVLLAGIATAASQARTFRFGLLLGIPAVALRWSVYVDPTDFSTVASLVTNIAFLGFTAAVVVVAVAREREVSADTVFGGLSVYLLLGVIWALLYGLLEALDPPALVGAQLATPEGLEGLWIPGGFQRMIYFSFVTLTTLGYGDIRPASDVARMFATAEAITGQLFIAVFIARLIGAHAARSSKP